MAENYRLLGDLYNRGCGRCGCSGCGCSGCGCRRCGCSGCSGCSGCVQGAAAGVTAPCDPTRVTCNGQQLFYCGECGAVAGQTACKGCCPRCYQLYENT